MSDDNYIPWWIPADHPARTGAVVPPEPEPEPPVVITDASPVGVPETDAPVVQAETAAPEPLDVPAVETA